MAKRSRVPAHKALPQGQTARNKNPKLSPYQRELKRNRLANQAPHVVHQKGGGRGAAGLRDEPAKARDLIKYLNAKNEYEAEKVRVKANRSHAIRQAKRDAAKGIDGDAEESEEDAHVAEDDSIKASDAAEEGGDVEDAEETDEEMDSDNVEGIEVAAGGVTGSVVVLTPAQKRVVELKTMKKLKKSSNNHLKALMTKKERVIYFGINKGDEEAEKGPATAAVSATDNEEAEEKRQALLAVLVRRSGVLDTALDNERERLTKLVQAAERKHAKKLRNGGVDEEEELVMSAPTKAEATAAPVGGYKKRKKGEEEDEGGPVQASVCDVNQEMLVEAGMAREKKVREAGDDSDISSDSSSEIDTREMHHSGMYDDHTTALMKRKERKHLKKMEKRRDKRADQLADIEREVHQLTSKTYKKKMRKEARGTDEEKYEANLYKMQAEERRIGGKRERDEGQQGEESQKAVKRLSGLGDEEMSMREAIEEMRGGAGKNRASGIRFGERVDAPPTFDNVPSMDVMTSLNKLATKLAAPQPLTNKNNSSQKPTTNLGRTAKNSLGVPRDYVQGSPSMGLQEKKRLAKLGLRGRVNEAHGQESGGDSGAPSHSNGGKASTSEFEAMRSKVMDNYAASKRRAHEQMLAAKKEAGPRHKKRNNIANFVVSGGGEDEGFGSMGGGKFTDGKKFF